MSYDVVWYPGQPLRCTILKGIPENRFALREKETPEERLKRKELEANSSSGDNLRRLLRNYHDSKWRASELYPWFEKFAPGYQFFPLKDNNVMIEFADLNHVMLFKLTWI